MTDGLIDEIADSCIVTRARLVSRVVSDIYDSALRRFGISAAQMILLVMICRVGPVTRAALGRFHQQGRSTLTRNLQIMLKNGWVGEIADGSGGRARPMFATAAGRRLLAEVEPAWRASQVETNRLLGEQSVSMIIEIGNRLFDASGL